MNFDFINPCFEIRDEKLLGFSGDSSKIKIPPIVKTIAYNVFDHCFGANDERDVCLEVDFYTMKYCDNNDLDYETKNKAFFAVVSYCEHSKKNETIALNIYGEIDSEFEELDDEYGLTKVISIHFENAEKLSSNMLLPLPGVKTIYVPATVCEIERGAFYVPLNVSFKDNTICGLDSIIVANDNPCFTSHQGILFSRDMKQLICCPPARVKSGHYEIPDFVETVLQGAFDNCFFINDLYVSKHVCFEPGSLSEATNLRSVYVKNDCFFDMGSLPAERRVEIHAHSTASFCIQYALMTGALFVVDDTNC